MEPLLKPDAQRTAIVGGMPRRLFNRYARDFALILGLVVLVSGGIGVYFSYQDTRALVDELQREKARGAAARIGQFIQSVELQMRGALIAGRTDGRPDLDARHTELVRLLRIASSISDAAWIDTAGRERVRVSRLAPDAMGGDIDRSRDPAVIAANGGKTGYGEIRFHRQSVPHLEVAISGDRREDGIVIAVLNLEFASDVVAGIRVGERGKAYAVDGRGRLIIHPEPGKALQMTSLSDHPQVDAALKSTAGTRAAQATVIARAENGSWVIAASAPVDPPGWHVVVEQPVGEAFASMFESLVRTVLLLAAGMVLAVVLSRVLARRMIAPIRVLENGARRIGEGNLEERVEVHTGDELEELAGQFNRMALRLRESYAVLEQKVEERTLQLEEANRAKSRFLAAASHDLRQPVHALGLFVAQLDEAHDEAARKRLIGKVAASSAAVSDLIEALLDISRLDAGAVVPRTVDFPLRPLFDRIEHTLSFAAQEKGLRLRIRPSPLCVRTDPMLLERILLNLCTNAIRYTARGGVILTARVRKSAVRIEVWDTGSGISPEQQAHIFEEFYQVSAVHDGSSKGLGLGLAIVRRLARLLELSVNVRSVLHRGSVFAVDVPVARLPADSAPVLSHLLGAARFDGLPVMLIDDDAVARDATEGLLAQWGCRVCAVACGEDASRRLSIAAPPRLIICDYHLANDELGTDVIRQLRVLANHDIPAVIVSADATQALRDAAAAARLHLFHKPVNAARLRALLMHIVGNPESAVLPA